MRISEAINKLTDAIAARLPDSYSSEQPQDTQSSQGESTSSSSASSASWSASSSNDAVQSSHAPRHLDDLVYLVHGHLPNKVRKRTKPTKRDGGQLVSYLCLYSSFFLVEC